MLIFSNQKREKKLSMDNEKEAPRARVRYKRPDINVLIKMGMGKLFYAELLDISQQGMSIRLDSKLRVNKDYKFLFQFSDKKRFELKGKVISKLSGQQQEKVNLIKRILCLFTSDCAVTNYGIMFEMDRGFKSHLLNTGMEKHLRAKQVMNKKLRHRSRKEQ